MLMKVVLLHLRLVALKQEMLMVVHNAVGIEKEW